MKKGFTLVEILVSIVILTFVILAILQGAIIIINHSAYLKQKRTAIEIAQNKMSELLSKPASELSDGSEQEEVASITYNITWTITSTTSPSGKEILLTISWQTRNKNYSINMVSWKAL